MAQLVEQAAHNCLVTGSNPVRPTRLLFNFKNLFSKGMKNIMKKSILISILFTLLSFSIAMAKEYVFPVTIDGNVYTAHIVVNDKTDNIESIVMTNTNIITNVAPTISSPQEAKIIDAFTLTFIKPSTNSDLCGTFLEDGEIVSVIGKNKDGTWVKLDLDGEQCWIRSRQIDKIPSGVNVVQ